jgi:hypothetical protein
VIDKKLWCTKKAANKLFAALFFPYQLLEFFIQIRHQLTRPFGLQSSVAVIIIHIDIPEAKAKLLPVKPRPHMATPKAFSAKVAP